MFDFIGIDEVEERIYEYIQVLNERATTIVTEDYQVEYGRKFAKIFAYNNGKKSCIHAFVNLNNGDVIKPATYKAPQKNADGTFAVRFNLIDDESRELMYSVVDFAGSYLYKR